MFKTHTSVLLAVSLAISTGLAHAQQQANTRCYTTASLYGSYAVVVNYGANFAMGLQPEILDGAGNLSRTGINNQPVVDSPTGARTVGNVTSTGTYTVNCDGTGKITRVVTRPDGTKATAEDDFVITEAMERDGRLIASTIVDVQRDPSVIAPGGIFVTRVHTLRPNAPNTGAFGTSCYTIESVQGNWVTVNNYGTAVAMGLQPETLDANGNLTRTGILNQPQAGSTTGARTVGNVTSVGTYKVNCNGTGTIDRVVTRPDGTKAVASDDFLITRAIEQDGKLIATTIVDAQRDASVILPGGVFLSRTHTRRPSQAVAAGGGGGSTPPTQASTTAVAGPKGQSVMARTISLDGSASTSADGKPLTFQWSIPQGSPSAAILGGDTANPTVQFSQGRGVYTFLLTVTDSTGLSATDIVTVEYLGM